MKYFLAVFLLFSLNAAAKTNLPPVIDIYKSVSRGPTWHFSSNDDEAARYHIFSTSPNQVSVLTPPSQFDRTYFPPNLAFALYTSPGENRRPVYITSTTDEEVNQLVGFQKWILSLGVQVYLQIGPVDPTKLIGYVSTVQTAEAPCQLHVCLYNGWDSATTMFHCAGAGNLNYGPYYNVEDIGFVPASTMGGECKDPPGFM